MVRVKICGITRSEDAIDAAYLGADALGFVFYSGSKRYIDPGAASKIIKSLPPFITPVGVFVNEDKKRIQEVKSVSGIDLVQIHGDEDPDFCNSLGMKYIKACRVTDRDSLENIRYYNTSFILLDSHSEDSYGGTGRTFNWKDASSYNFFGKSIILSGGLNSDNVRNAINLVNPYAVDVSSGVESAPGIKDHTKLKDFIEAIKNENRSAIS